MSAGLDAQTARHHGARETPGVIIGRDVRRLLRFDYHGIPQFVDLYLMNDTEHDGIELRQRPNGR